MRESTRRLLDLSSEEIHAKIEEAKKHYGVDEGGLIKLAVETLAKAGHPAFRTKNTQTVV